MTTDRIAPVAPDLPGSSAPVPETAPRGIALLDRPAVLDHRVAVENLFVPAVQPTAPLTPGLGHALGAGRRRRLSGARLSDTPGAGWTAEQYRQLEQAVEDAFTGTWTEADSAAVLGLASDTGELVRPYIDSATATIDLPLDLVDPIWDGVVVPPPTPVREATARPAPAPIPTPLPSRRQLRERRRVENSPRTQAVRRLAKGGVLAVTMFGVVATNAPKTLHDRLFASQEQVTELVGAPGAAALVGGAAAEPLAGDTTARRQSLIEDAVRQRLVKAQVGRTVSEAGQDAAGAVVAAAKAQASVEAAAQKAALDKAISEARQNPRAVAQLMVAKRGWSDAQFVCLNKLWTKESGWRWNAENPTSSAYGIPQALPGSKMASVGADWRTNVVTQITWGLNYITDRYGTPCSAWSHSVSYNWY